MKHLLFEVCISHQIFITALRLLEYYNDSNTLRLLEYYCHSGFIDEELRHLEFM